MPNIGLDLMNKDDHKAWKKKMTAHDWLTILIGFNGSL